MTNWDFTPYAVTLFASGGISLALAFFCLRRRIEKVAFLLGLALLAEAWWSINVGLSSASVPLAQKLIFTKLSYFGVYNCVPLFLLFALQYADLGRWLTRRNIILMWIAPSVVMVSAATNELHHLIWTGFVPPADPSLNEYIFLRGPLYWLGVVNNYAMLLAMSIVLVYKAIHTRLSLYRWQVFVISIGILPVWVANFIYVIAFKAMKGFDLTPIAFSVTGVLLYSGIKRFHFLDLYPIARDALFERIKDGIVVLDSGKRIVDVNLVGEKYLTTGSERIIGQPASLGGLFSPACSARYAPGGCSRNAICIWTFNTV